MALADAGLLDAVESLMVDLATLLRTRLAWKEALGFERHSDMIQSVAALLSERCSWMRCLSRRHRSNRSGALLQIYGRQNVTMKILNGPDSSGLFAFIGVRWAWCPNKMGQDWNAYWSGSKAGDNQQW